MSRRLSLVLSLFFVVPALHAAPPTEKINPEDEKLLKANKVSAEAPALLDYLRKRTITAKDRDKIDGLIRLLGDDSFKVREKASDDLLALGTTTLPQLRQALNDPDEEIKEQAREGIAAVESKTNPALSLAVIRVLRVRAPAETVKTLLEYLPDADSDAVTDEVLMTLAVLGVKENKIDALLVAALNDKLPARRAAAALVLGRSGTVDQRRAVEKLLTDADGRVRFRAAQGLLAARERTALPALIALLGDAPPDLATRAEELLSCVAGSRALHQPITDNVQQNRLVGKNWEQWWKLNAKLDLTRADVDLPPFNTALRARETARQFMAVASTADKEKLDKLFEVPFYTGADQLMTNREQVSVYLTNLIQNMGNRGVGGAPVVQGTMTVEDFMKTAQPREQALLVKMRKADVRVVQIQWPQQNMGRGINNTIDLGGTVCTIFVRVTGDQPQIIGIGFSEDRLLRDKW